MRKGGGKAKGSHFERVIAKMIVKAFKKHGIQQRECWRSVNSGGHIIAAGDLEMSDRLMKLFPYAVECKFRKRIKWFLYMLDGASSKAEEIKWLAQAKEGATKIANLRPLLVMKENGGKIYCMKIEGAFLKLELFSKFLKRVAK